MERSLLQILTRFRGLQSLEIDFYSEWDDPVPIDDNPALSKMLKPERFGRNFLLLIKNDLGHIQAITIVPHSWHGNIAHIPRWISHELTKRNTAWAPPPPVYMNFHRTISNLSLLHSQTIVDLADSEESYSIEKDKKSVSYLVDIYGVFP